MTAEELKALQKRRVDERVSYLNEKNAAAKAQLKQLRERPQAAFEVVESVGEYAAQVEAATGTVDGQA